MQYLDLREEDGFDRGAHGVTGTLDEVARGEEAPLEATQVLRDERERGGKGEKEGGVEEGGEGAEFFKLSGFGGRWVRASLYEFWYRFLVRILINMGTQYESFWSI
jgi:hypothetical protein